MKKKNVGYTAVISVALTALISGFLLSFVYSVFAEDIKLNGEKVITEGVKTVMPSAVTIEGPLTDDSVTPYYIGYDDNENIVGYAILSKGTGYNGTITLLVGFDSGITYITGVTPTEQAETPGLGAKITEDEFRKQFYNKALEENIVVVKGIAPEEAGDYEIAAITGATISAVAVAEAVNLAKKEALLLLDKNWDLLTPDTNTRATTAIEYSEETKALPDTDK